jgi:thiamine biosynthesis lipoprotein
MSVPMSHFSFSAIGTSWDISSTPPGLETQRRVLDLVEQFDAIYSRFRDDSLITRIAEAPNGGTFEFPPSAVPMFNLYDQLYEATGGAVDPLVGRDLELLGYDRHYSLTPSACGVVASAVERPTWRHDVVRDGRTIVTHKPLTIDLGAAGKGYLVDLVSRLLMLNNVDAFIIDASGDMVHRVDEVLDVGLEHPFDPSLVVGIARLRDASLCASAINRRAWGDGLHHVIDGRTGTPVNDVVAAWVVANDTATADGLATALFFVPASRLTSIADFSFVRLFSDGTAEVSDNFDGEVFT